MVGVSLVVICVITKGKLKLVFDYDRYLKDLQGFLTDMLNDPEVKKELNQVYKDVYRAARLARYQGGSDDPFNPDKHGWKGHGTGHGHPDDGPGPMFWYGEESGPFRDMDIWATQTATQARVTADGKVQVIIGFPPPKAKYWGAENPGVKYWQFVFEYGIGSSGIGHGSAQAGKPLKYHHEGEQTWSPVFEEQKSAKAYVLAGQEMPSAMNQKGLHVFSEVREEVYRRFYPMAVKWFDMFKDIYPFGDYIKFK